MLSVGANQGQKTKILPNFWGEFSGAICRKSLVLLRSALELFRKFFGVVLAILWLWGSSLALKLRGFPLRGFKLMGGKST